MGEEGSTQAAEPIHVIETGARGLSAYTVGTDKIYMGFMGSMATSNIQIHVYSLDYEQLGVVELPIEDNIVSEMILCHEGKWLVCTHR